MATQSKRGVRFTFGYPVGARTRKASEGMKRALKSLTTVTEMRRFVAEAHKQGRDVVVEVYHASDGHPLLLHITAVLRRTQTSNLIQ